LSAGRGSGSSAGRDHVTGSDDRPLPFVPMVSEAEHGTSPRWHAGCRCTQCRRAHSDTQRAWGRARAHKRLPLEVRQQLLDAIYAGQPFRTVLRDLDLTSNQVFGLTRTDDEWSTKLEAALTASRREDLEHGTDAAYITAVFAATAGRISRFG